jgi:hypothetical protein
MNLNIKALLVAFAVAATALSVTTMTASAQYRGSVYGPYYNPHIPNNGTGTVPDWNRDPHNDRGGGFGGGNG